MIYFWQIILVVSLYFSLAVNAQPITLVANTQSNTELITELLTEVDIELDNKVNTQLSPALVPVLKTEFKPELQPELQPEQTSFGHAQPLRIAVAANFSPVLKPLLTEFTAKTGIQTQVISAASGAIFIQIKYGAPFDVFLSADSSRPIQLEQSGHALPGSRATYAIGRLAFYSSTIATTSIDTLATQLSNKPRTRLAMANPDVAPYGKAAKEVLQHMQLWESYQSQFITGINISQTFTQLRSKSINQGFIAYSQLKANNLTGVLIPASYHQPIQQQLVILQNTLQPEAAAEFRQFLLSDQSQAFIENSGYAVRKQETK